MQEVDYLLQIMRLTDYDFCKLCLLVFRAELNQDRSSSCPILQSYFPKLLIIAVLGLSQNDKEWKPIHRSLLPSLFTCGERVKYCPDYIKVALFSIPEYLRCKGKLWSN